MTLCGISLQNWSGTQANKKQFFHAVDRQQFVVVPIFRVRLFFASLLWAILALATMTKFAASNKTIRDDGATHPLSF
jgi:hypothetical protein